MAETQTQEKKATPEEKKLWSAEYIGSGTFLIVKPKRNKKKLRLSRVRNRRRGMRK